MKNRSQSERGLGRKGGLLNLKYKSSKQAGLIQQKEKLAGQLSDLQQKIQVSKPILQDIYSKMRQKQKIYQQTISREVHRGQKRGQLADQYRKLYGEGLKIMARNNIEAFDGYAKYTKLNIQQSQIEDQNKGLVKDKIGHSQSISAFHKSNNIQAHDDQREFDRYKKPLLQKQNRNLTNSVSAKNIYQRYRRKIDEQVSENETTLNKVRRLSKEIDRDINELRLNKNNSGANLKCNKYGCFPLSKQTKDKKTYFLQLQKRKLRKI